MAIRKTGEGELKVLNNISFVVSLDITFAM